MIYCGLAGLMYFKDKERLLYSCLFCSFSHNCFLTKVLSASTGLISYCLLHTSKPLTPVFVVFDDCSRIIGNPVKFFSNKGLRVKRKKMNR